MDKRQISSVIVVVLAITFIGASVASSKIKTLKKIKAGSITNPYIGDGAVNSAKIEDGTVSNGDIADNSITTGKIADGQVSTDDLADNAVTTGKISDGTIAAGDLADSAVTSAKISDGTVDGADLKTNMTLPSNINMDSGTLYIDRGNNRIGIGTASAQNSLDIYGAQDVSLASIEGRAESGILFRTEGKTRWGIFNIWDEFMLGRYNDNGDLSSYTIYIDRDNEYVGIGTGGNAASRLQVHNGYFQLDSPHTAAPSGSDCNAEAEDGRMYWDSTNDDLYVCSGASGWKKFDAAP